MMEEGVNLLRFSSPEWFRAMVVTLSINDYTDQCPVVKDNGEAVQSYCLWQQAERFQHKIPGR